MYMNGPTMDVLGQLNRDWLSRGDGPIVTMDAGSNIHLLFRADQAELVSRNPKPMDQQI